MCNKTYRVLVQSDRNGGYRYLVQQWFLFMWTTVSWERLKSITDTESYDVAWVCPCKATVAFRSRESAISAIDKLREDDSHSRWHSVSNFTPS